MTDILNLCLTARSCRFAPTSARPNSFPIPSFYGHVPSLIQCVLSSYRLRSANQSTLRSVAVFDVLQSPSREDAYVLLQPRPRLQDIFPKVDLLNAVKENRFPNFKSAYVGIVEETGSLFAMSPDRFPLVVFSDANTADEYGVGRSIDPPPGSRWDFDPELNLPVDVDSVFRRAKLRQLCRSGSRDKRCYVGVKELESSQLSRLLDGAPSVPLPPYFNSQNTEVAESTDGNASVAPPGNNLNTSPPKPAWPRNFGLQGVLVAMFSLTAILGATIWTMKKIPDKPSPDHVAIEQNGHVTDVKPELSSPSTQIESIPPVEAALAEPVTVVDDVPPSSQADIQTTSRARKVSFRAEVDSRPPSRAGQNGDDAAVDGGEGEDSEGEGDAPAASGKKKAPRRKRGKKKKGSPLAANGREGPDMEDKNAENSDPSPEPQPNGSAHVVHVVSASAIIVPPPTTPTPVVPSLIVSDTILGKFTAYSCNGYPLIFLTQASDPMVL